ncbi:MAG: hypothetical protein GC162_14445 [Planctomycetes bacterium]|nr:hypothetical protein [Planctomycetota bacterium]
MHVTSDTNLQERMALYFHALGRTEHQSRKLAAQLLTRLGSEPSEPDARVAAAMDLVMAEAQRLRPTGMLLPAPIAPPPSPGAMPRQFLGRTPVVLRAGFWRRLFTRIRRKWLDT